MQAAQSLNIGCCGCSTAKPDTPLPQLLHQRLRAQAELFYALTSHPTLIGSGREDALAELFRQFMPRRYEILSGTVAVTTADRQPSRSTQQLDIIVADTTDFPTLLRLGNVAVVLSQSVRAVIEVKSDLERGAKFIDAIVQIARARQLMTAEASVLTGLFSFGAPTQPGTLRGWLEDVFELRSFIQTKEGTERIKKIYNSLIDGDERVAENDDDLLRVLANENLPAIVAADRGAVARKIQDENDQTVYTFLDCKDEPSVIVLIDAFIEQLGTTATATATATDRNVSGALMALRDHLAIDVSFDAAHDDLVLPDNLLRGQP